MEVCLKGTENKPKEAGVAHFKNYRVINALIIVAIQGGKSTIPPWFCLRLAS